MITIFGQHAVTDYEAWKRFLDAAPREHYDRFGIVGESVYRTVDGSAVIVMHTFNNLEDAQKHKNMMESADGKAMIEQNGGKLPLTYWMAEEVER